MSSRKALKLPNKGKFADLFYILKEKFEAEGFFVTPEDVLTLSR